MRRRFSHACARASIFPRPRWVSHTVESHREPGFHFSAGPPQLETTVAPALLLGLQAAARPSGSSRCNFSLSSLVLCADPTGQKKAKSTTAKTSAAGIEGQVGLRQHNRRDNIGGRRCHEGLLSHRRVIDGENVRRRNRGTSWVKAA